MDPQTARWLIPEITEQDGRVGYLVTRHWSRYVPYWLTAVPVSVIVLVGWWFLLTKGALSLGDWWVIAMLVLNLAIVFKVTVIWWHKLKKEVLLITPMAVYEQRQEALLWFTVRVVNLSEYTAHRTHVEGWGVLHRRTVVVETKGTAVIYPHAAGWEELEHALSEIVALRPS